MKSRFWVIGGYAGFFLASFLFSLYLTFDPSHLVTGYLQQFAQQKGMQVSVAAIEKYRLSGIIAEDIELQHPGLRTPLKVDGLQARLSLWPLLLGRKSIGFQASLYGGKIFGRITRGRNSLRANLEVRSVDLSKLEPAREKSLWAMAKLTGKADLDLASKDDPKKWRGALKASLGPGRLTSFSYQGFELPEIQIEGMNLELNLAGGKAGIKTLEIESTDFPINGFGQVELRSPVRQSPLQFQVKVDPSEQYLEKVPPLKAMLPSDKTVKYTGTLGAIIGAGI